MKLLLDTCTFIWLAAEPRKLSAKAKRLLRGDDAKIMLSDLSVLEICFKQSAGKLQLPMAAADWIEEQSEIWELEKLPISRSVFYRASELAMIHRDPFDRLLVATALEYRATILSPDKVVAAYPVTCVW